MGNKTNALEFVGVSEMSDEDLAAILADGKAQKGQYADILKAFAESGKSNICLSLTEGQFAGKNPPAVRQSLIQNAEKLGLDNVRVYARKEFVVITSNGVMSA